MGADYEQSIKYALDTLDEFSVLEPPVPIYEIAEGAGLDVLLGSLPHDVSGYIDLDEKRIVLNEDDSPVRRAFTVAHELGHYFMHQPWVLENPDNAIMYRKSLVRETDKNEQEANAYAANLLVPEKFLKPYKLLPTSTIATIFGVSREVIGYRFKSLRWVPFGDHSDK